MTEQQADQLKGSANQADAVQYDEAAAALGVGQPGSEQGEEQEDQESEEETPFDELPKRTQDEIRRLRRENAALRLKSREARKAAQSGGGNAPSATDVEAAREAGRAEAREEFGLQLTEARVRASLTGVVPDDRIDETVEDLNISRFLGEGGKPDDEAIKSLREKYVALLGTRKTPKVNHGRNGNAPATKSNADQFGEVLAGLLNS